MSTAVGTAVFQVYRDASGQFRWRMIAANSKIIADSAESFVSRQGAHASAELVRRLAPSARIEDKF
jgi:uncharacterized protein YegP (UPF0339 family)